ncbi:MAG: carboxypeptidase regulatory-like domain-containing protein [Planctomycetaceae bacterium]|nr:carboxypeptidase regulatory-like domain-containing protein [Planctomycetaceae bacterium]
MNTVEAFLWNRTSFVETIGLTLMHFVWQGLLVAVLLKAMMVWMSRSSAQRRYAVCCLALLALAILPPVTFVVLNETGQGQEVAEETIPMATPVAESDSGMNGNAARIDSENELPQHGSLGSGKHSLQNRSAEHSGLVSSENVEARSATSPFVLSAESRRWALQAATAVWMLGVVFLSVRLLLSWAWVRRIKSSGTSCSNSEIAQAVTRLSRKLGIHRFVALLESAEIDVPMVIGWLRPAILLPLATVNSLSVSQLEAILAHELEHIRRADYLVNFVQNLVETVLFYHPAVWWVSSRIRQEREHCCDDVAAASCGNARHYVAALLRLEELRSVPKSVIVASTGGNLLQRARRLLVPVESHEVVPRWHAGAALLIATLGIGLTHFNRFPSAEASAVPQSSTVKEPVTQQAANSSGSAAAEVGEYTVEGICADAVDHAPLKGVDVRLFVQQGLMADVKEVGRAKTDENGEFRFPNLPAPSNLVNNKVQYVVLAHMAGRPPVYGPISLFAEPGRQGRKIHIAREGDALSGRVVDEQGRPVSGANVKSMWWLPSEIEGTPHFLTGDDGLFRLAELPVMANETDPGASVVVSHPDYPTTTVSNLKVPGTAKLVLPEGCPVSGVVQDVAGKPVPGAVISVVPESNRDSRNTEYCRTDADGKFKICVENGIYSFMLSHDAYVSEALTGVECRKGKPVQLQTMIAQEGGWLTGQIFDTKTSKPLVRSESGQNRISIGVYGKANPSRTEPMAEVDDDGRFKVRVMPGENFPFTINQRTTRMSWDTQRQPPVIVKSGEEAFIQIDIVRRESTPDMLARANKIIDSLPKAPEARAEAIIAELRNFNKTVDGCEVWCALLREVVKIGPPAVLPLCKELESTQSNPMMRRISVALRALNDPRAVPSLIRTLPRTLLPSSSDFGLIVEDAELASFMRENSINGEGSGNRFDLGRPVREVHAAIQHLTKHNLQASKELASMSRRADLRALNAQEKTFHKAASEWAVWWEANAQSFKVPEEFGRVNLPPFVDADLSDYPTGLTLTPNAQEDSGVSRMVLSPASEDGPYTRCFLDLDTERDWRWPAELANKSDTPEAAKSAMEWARQHGADLICTARQESDGTLQYVLTSVDAQVWEIDALTAQNIEQHIKKGELPTGRKLEQPELLHFDPVTGKHVPMIGSSFLYLTKDEGLGLITITDFVVVARDISGLAGVPPGVGFHRGVRFDLTFIAR